MYCTEYVQSLVLRAAYPEYAARTMASECTLINEEKKIVSLKKGNWFTRGTHPGRSKGHRQKKHHGMHLRPNSLSPFRWDCHNLVQCKCREYVRIITDYAFRTTFEEP